MPLSPRTLRPSSSFTPRSISGLALWLDASQTGDLYTTDAGPVVPVSSPTEISGCVGWWDASDAATLFAADTGSTLATTTVGRWANKGTLGSAADLLQATAGSRPATGSSTRNGRNVLSFDGTDDWMQRSFTLAQPCTVFIVFSYSVAFSATTTLIDGAGAGNTLRFAPTSNTDAIFVTGGNNPQFNLSAWGAMNAWQQASFVANGSASASLARRNGLQAVNGSGATATATNPNGLTVASWGAFGLQYANAQYAEIIVFNSALSAADIARVEAYLAQRWGISGVHAAATSANDPVGYWRDRSGNGRHAVQATGGRRPAAASGASGRRTLAFTGAATNSNALTIPTYPSGDSSQLFTAFIVARETSPTASVSSRAVVGFVDGSGVGFRLALTITGGNGNPGFYPSAATGFNGVAGSNAVVYSVTKEDTFATYAFRGNAALAALNNIPGVGTFFPNQRVTGVSYGLSAFLTSIGASNGGVNGLTGQISEIIGYTRALSDAERLRVERYLAAKWGIVLAPQVSNADAQDWVNRVYANGGTVTASTAAAVNQFCIDIENAPGGSIRDRFYRLNLFCGTGLNACLVPLYRGQSLGGAQFGNATDTNNGPFVAGDYGETGAGGGLLANGSSQYLNTGVPMNFTGLRDYHLSAYLASAPSGNSGLLGADTNGDGVSPRAYQGLVTFNTTPRSWIWYNIATSFLQPQSLSNAHAPGLITGVGSATANVVYAGASAVGSEAAATNETVSRTFPIFVFAVNNRNAVVNNFANVRLGGYSIGLAMNATQLSAYNTAMRAFQTALQRNV